jgi:hypothetical protein
MTDLSDYNKTRFSLDEGKNGARPTSLARPQKVAVGERGTMTQRPNLPVVLQHVIAAAEAASAAAFNPVRKPSAHVK